MGSAVRKTISLPADLAKGTEDIARAEGKILSAVVQDDLRLARIQRLKNELNQIQDYWSKKAKEKGFSRKKTWPAFLKKEALIKL